MSRIINRFAAVLLFASLMPALQSQPIKPPAPSAAPQPAMELPDAERTKQELGRLLYHYPSNLRDVLGLDPTLLTNQAFLQPYPALTGFVAAHPEIAHSPAFYVRDFADRRFTRPESTQSDRNWDRMFGFLNTVVLIGVFVGVLIWLIRTVIDYRRWNRLSKIQTDVHTKLLDRFSGNEDLLSYIQSPAGSKFLESTPITLDPGPRAVAAPLGRILWSVQAGIVCIATGFGLAIIANHFPGDTSLPFRALGILGIALGIGFAFSAIVSYVISNRLGLIDAASPAVQK